jgi:hypothetical protein
MRKKNLSELKKNLKKIENFLLHQKNPFFMKIPKIPTFILQLILKKIVNFFIISMSKVMWRNPKLLE